MFMNGSLFMSCELNRCFPKNSNSWMAQGLPILTQFKRGIAISV